MKSFPFSRIAIVNRGEPAVRLLRAVRELNEERGLGLRAIALYTEPDRDSLFVRESDESYALGPATFLDDTDGRLKSSYLDYARLRRALVETRAEAVWVGWGFVAEHAAFVDLCTDLGVTFIGPPSRVMQSLGDKISAKRIAEQNSVPVSPWSGGPVDNLDAARQHAARLGFPLMVKATAGGGGRGIRRAKSLPELDEIFPSARAEAAKAFGDDTVFLERAIVSARHIEVQIAADRAGTTWALGVRDCSVQRRNQKVIEEAPAAILSPAKEAEIKSAAARLAQGVGYLNVGTVEFLYSTALDEFYFMEMNTRLQVEHPVTELTTGVDLVKLQLCIAAGELLSETPPPSFGHAVEVRLNAEDPDNQFAPSPGRLLSFRLPSGPGLRADSGFVQGDVIPSQFDSMMAKLIAFGRTREEALARLRRGLSESAVIIEAGASNKAFLLELLRHETVLQNQVDITWLDRLREGPPVPRPFADIALVQAAIAAYEQEFAQERAAFLAAAARGRTSVREDIGLEVELRHGPDAYSFVVCRRSPQRYLLRVDGVTLYVELQSVDRNEAWLSLDGRRYRVITTLRGSAFQIEVDGALHRIERDSGGVVRATSPAVVLALKVREGDRVEIGQTVALLEAMKMEIPVVAPVAGRVKLLLVGPNEQVPAGAPLIELEAEQDRVSEGASHRVTFAKMAPPSSEDPVEAAVLALDKVRRFLMGFDVAPKEMRAALVTFEERSRQLGQEDPRITAREEQILSIFVDLLAVHGRNYLSPEDHLSPAECLGRFFRSLDSAGAGLPEKFLERLRRLLGHYGVTSLERSPALEDALLWGRKAELRSELLEDPVAQVLERRIANAAAHAARRDPNFFTLLERLIEVTYPNSLALNDLARQARFLIYDKPLLADMQGRELEEIKADLARLVARPEQPEPALIERIAHSPEPVAGLLARLMNQRHLGGLMLELLIRRFYRASTLGPLSPWSVDGGDFLKTTYQYDGHQGQVLASLVDEDALARSLAIIAQEAERTVDLRADCYVRLAGPEPERVPSVEHLRRLATEAGLASRSGRICFVFVTPEQARADYITFALEAGEIREVPEYRGLHPMWAGRLELWRLRSFHAERLAAPDDIYLYRAKAKENPKDERLFAFIDVRSLTVVHDQDGSPTLPQLERLFLDTMSCMRDYLYRLPTAKRLYWNRVMFYLWPELPISRADLTRIMDRLSRETHNLGIEKVVLRVRQREEPEASPWVSSSPELWAVSMPQLAAVSMPQLGTVSAANAPAAKPPVKKAAPRLEAQRERQPGLTAYWLRGPLDAGARLARLAEPAEGRILALCEQVSSLGAGGLDRLAELTAACGERLVLARVPLFVAAPLLNAPEALGAARIVSIVAPVACSSCKHVTGVTLDRDALANTPSHRCARCGKAQPLPEELLPILRRAVSGEAPSEAARYLASRPSLESAEALEPLRLDAGAETSQEIALHFSIGTGQVVRLRPAKPSEYPIRPLSAYAQRVVQLRSRGLVYPYEIIRLLTAKSEQHAVLFPPGEFTEYDLNEQQQLVPVQRPAGENTANLVVGVIKNFTKKHPEGMSRVIILGDPSREMGSLAEPECRRISEAVSLARSLRVPIDWFPISSGAKIAFDSGTENLDWTAHVLRKIIEFTQGGGEINMIVAGINVGAQSYWNAEATMLMHTRGVLIMTPPASMVLTGKKALEYSGSVAAADHPGIGGVEAIMGPNGQAQYLAKNVGEALQILLRYYEHAYIAPGETSPRPADTSDPNERDVTLYPYLGAKGEDFATIGEVFSPEKNPSRKRAFSIRPVMAAVIDQDLPYLERWSMMREAETGVVWDAHIGGLPVSLLGFESHPVSRGGGHIPGDGPDSFSGGTLFPMSSKKIARAINAASGNRPVVVLANLSGFDGSPESMRKLQLEYGAEIGRAVVNFVGPMVFCVISRYHGGAYVVFSRALNPNLRVAALEGSYASVIGGAPAAAVVLTREVNHRVYSDPRIVEAQAQLRRAEEGQRARLSSRFASLLKEVQAEKQGQIAEEFERVHDIARAKAVGSIEDVIKPNDLRPYIISSIERGLFS